MRQDREVPSATATARKRMIDFLLRSPATALEISGKLRMSQREVAAHLEHLGKSVKAAGMRLCVEPAECFGCGYVFAERKKYTKPGKCPVCRSERINPPRFIVLGPDYS